MRRTGQIPGLAVRPRNAAEPVAGTAPASGSAANGRAAAPPGLSVREQPPPLLGPVGRSLTRLFPAAPVRTWPVPALGIAAIYIAAIAAGALILLVRQAGNPAWNTIWGEDGGVFLPGALQHPWSSLFQPYAGYLQTVPRLIAECAALLPFSAAAAVFAVGGALVASACAALVFHASAGHVRTPALRVVLAASVVLLPTALIEVANSAVDSPWFLMYALFWVLLWRPRSRAGLALAALLGLATMASQIVAIVYLPLAVARVIALPRVREHAVTAGLLIGAAVQVRPVMMSREVHPSHLARALGFYFHQVITPAVAGRHVADVLQAITSSGLACVAIAAVLVAALIGWALVSGGPRSRTFVVAAMVMGLLLTLIPAMDRSRVTVAAGGVAPIWVPGDRYTIAPILLIDAVAVVAVDAWLRRGGTFRTSTWQRRAACAVLAVLVVTWAADFRYGDLRSKYQPWPQVVNIARTDCRAHDLTTVHVPVLRTNLPCSTVGAGGRRPT
jgi:hypothetical protein